MHDLTHVDPDHRDEEILTAYATVMQMRAAGYAKDDRGELEDESADAIVQEHERTVVETWAATPTGVAAQLAMVLIGVNAQRWTDRGLAEQGLAALHQVRNDLGWSDSQLVNAAFELVHMEWDQALAEYHRATGDFNEALDLKGDVETEVRRVQDEGGAPSAFLTQMIARSDRLEERFCNADALHRLIRTLAPDFDAYRIKAGICIETGFSGGAGAWLLRDINFLSGKIEPAEVAA